MVPIGPRSAARLHAIHKEVTRPSPSANLSVFEADLDRWEAELDEYYKCGGDRLGEQTMIMTAKDMLPLDTSDAMHLAVKGVDSYKEFGRVIRASVQYLTDHGAFG